MLGDSAKAGKKLRKKASEVKLKVVHFICESARLLTYCGC